MRQDKKLLLQSVGLIAILFIAIGGLIAWGYTSSSNYSASCTEKGGVVFRSNYDQMCIKKDQVIDNIKIK